MKLAVLDDYMRVALASADWERLRARGIEIAVFDSAFASEDDAAARLAPFDIVVLMRERTHFTRTLIERLPNLRFIALTGKRAPSLDIAAASARGIPVSNTVGRESSASTAELAWLLLLAGARDLAAADRGMRAGGWHEGIRAGTVLEGRTLGLCGLGRLGSRVAGYGKAFGMDVIAWSPNLTAERAAQAGAAMVSKADLFARADFVSIHLVLGERTRGLVGSEDFARMKPTAVLVNTSRGPILDQDALLAALRAGRPGHAALDVYAEEPLAREHPLRGMASVTLSPHLGYVNSDVFGEFYRAALANVEAWLDGRPTHVLNPETLG